MSLNVLKGSREAIAGFQRQKEEKISSSKQIGVVAIASLIGFCFIGLFAMQIITGVAAAIAMVIGVSILYLGMKLSIAYSPVVQQKIRNAALDAQIKEARENAPIQLKNQVIENSKKLARAREARDKMGASVEKTKSKLAAMNPESQFFAQTKRTADSFEEAYETVCNNLEKAYKSNKDFETKVKEFCQMSEIANIANEAMAEMSLTGDAKNELLLEEAFDAIEMDFNESIISIENHARDMKLEDEE